MPSFLPPPSAGSGQHSGPEHQRSSSPALGLRGADVTQISLPREEASSTLHGNAIWWTALLCFTISQPMWGMGYTDGEEKGSHITFPFVG